MIVVYKYNDIVNFKVGEYATLDVAKEAIREQSKIDWNYIFAAYENCKVVATGIKGVVV